MILCFELSMPYAASWSSYDWMVKDILAFGEIKKR